MNSPSTASSVLKSGAFVPLIRTIGLFVKCCEFILGILLAGILIPCGVFANFFGRYAEVSILASRMPLLVGEYARRLYYKATLERVGKNVTFKFGSFCQYRSTAIGDDVLVGFYSVLGTVEIGSKVLIGGFVNILSGNKQHSFEDPNVPILQQPALGRTKVTIGSDVWIGSNCVIAADIGNRCVLGAGSVLVKPMPNLTVYAGNPGRLIRELKRPQT